MNPPIVYALVTVQMMPLTGKLITRIIEIWTHCTVYALMYLQITPLTERVLTHHRNMDSPYHEWGNALLEDSSINNRKALW
jgi:hypothetical protein